MKQVCQTTRAAFSGYLDGAITGVEMQSVSAHLNGCADCAAEFNALRGMQQVLAHLGPARAPEDLALKLRLAISHESARRQGRGWDSFTMRWANFFRPMLLQASAGLASAVLLLGTIGVLAGFVAAPEAVLANDEPLGALTAPHYLYSAAHGSPVITADGSSLVIEADVNSNGRIYDYRIVSGPQDAKTQAEVRDELMLAVYQPAEAFGLPVRGRVLITFSGVSVHG